MASRPWFALASSRLWFRNPKQWPCKRILLEPESLICPSHSQWLRVTWLLYTVMHTTDLRRAVHAQLAESEPCSTLSVLVSALRSHGEASNGVAFVPLHGVSNVDGGEVDVGLFLERTHMTRRLECLGHFHGSSLHPWKKVAPLQTVASSSFWGIPPVNFTVQLFSWPMGRINSLSHLTATHWVYVDLKSYGEKIHPSHFCHS